MKTRIIKTKIWSSASIIKLPSEARYLMIYLLTSDHIGLCGMFEIPDAFIQLETGLTTEQLNSAKKALEESGKIKFFEEWVYIVNHSKHNAYHLSPKTKVAYDREVSLIPRLIKEHFMPKGDSTIDTTMDSTPTIVPLIPNKETINKKPETIKEIVKEKKHIIDGVEIPF